MNMGLSVNAPIGGMAKGWKTLIVRLCALAGALAIACSVLAGCAMSAQDTSIYVCTKMTTTYTSDDVQPEHSAYYRTYDQNGNEIPQSSYSEVEDENGITTIESSPTDFEYDEAGWLTAWTDATRQTFESQFDSSGRLTSVVRYNSDGEAFAQSDYTYFDNGPLSSRTSYVLDPFGDSRGFLEFNEYGWVVSSTGMNQSLYTYTYEGDDLAHPDRATCVVAKEDGTLDYIAEYELQYDSDGNLIGQSSSTSNTTYEYEKIESPNAAVKLTAGLHFPVGFPHGLPSIII